MGKGSRIWQKVQLPQVRAQSHSGMNCHVVSRVFTPSPRYEVVVLLHSVSQLIGIDGSLPGDRFIKLFSNMRNLVALRSG